MPNDSEEVRTTPSETETTIKLGFYIGTFVLGFIGNLLVTAVITGKKNKRTVYDLFILNLGISDLSFIVFCLPIYIYEQFGRISKTLFYCRLVPSLLTVVYLLSMFTITSMAIHRCRLIINPYKPKPPRRTAFIWIGGIWLSSLVIVLPLSIVATSKGGDCDEQWPSMSHRRAYTVSLSILQFFLPLVIIAVAYLRIGIYLWRNTVPQTCLSTERNKKSHKRNKANKQVIKTVAAIVILFTVLLLPGQIAWLVLDFGGKQDKDVAMVIFKFSDILDCLHACVNPIIYALLTERFRRQYIRYFSYCFFCGEKRVREHDTRNNESSKDDSSPIRQRINAKTETKSAQDFYRQMPGDSQDTEESVPNNVFLLRETSAARYV